jgi:hypothetical protein
MSACAVHQIHERRSSQSLRLLTLVMLSTPVTGVDRYLDA